MNEEKIKACWNCYKIYNYSRNTSHYCSDNCRVQDHIYRTEEIRLAIYKLELDQKSERAIKSFYVLSEYKEKMEKKKSK